MKFSGMCVVACLMVCLTAAPSITEARSHSPIHAGDHVFDAVRFADSVKETAETVKAAMNTLEILGNHLKMLARAGDIRGMWKALENVSHLPLGRSADEYTDIFKKSWEAAEENSPYWPILNVHLAESNEDTGKAAEAVFLHQEDRNAARMELLNAEDDGILSERQRQNMEAALGAMDAIDQSELAGSRFVQRIEEQEAMFTSQRIEQEKVKAGVFYGYDPYHPNEYDMEHRTVKTHSLGFMEYGR